MAVSLLLVFRPLYAVPLGTEAQMLGQVTFSISYVVIIVRGRLLSIGPEYEEAARDLGASPLGAFRLVLLPLLVAGDLRELHRRLRALDRRLRRHRLHVGRPVDADRSDPDLLERARHGDACPQRRGDADGDRRRCSRSRSRTSSTAGRRARQPATSGGPPSTRSLRWRCDVKTGAVELVQLRKRVRRRRRGRRDRRLDRGGRVLLAARPVGLRQDDDAAADRRLRAARPTGRSCSTASTWPRRRRTAARSTPSSRATRSSPTSTCSTTSPSACGGRARRRPRSGSGSTRVLEAVHLGGVRQAQAVAALGRPAAAGRARARARPRAGGAAARRAARRARREAPQGAPARAEVDPGASSGSRSCTSRTTRRKR